MSMKSKGFVALYSLTLPKESKSLSATNSMYCRMREAFMPIRSTGSASTRQLKMSRGWSGGRGTTNRSGSLVQ